MNASAPGAGAPDRDAGEPLSSAAHPRPIRMARHTEHLFGWGGQVEISRRGRAGAVNARIVNGGGVVQAS